MFNYVDYILQPYLKVKMYLNNKHVWETRMVNNNIKNINGGFMDSDIYCSNNKPRGRYIIGKRGLLIVGY